MIPTREQLEQGRREGYRLYGYFHSFCELNKSCEECEPVIRRGCERKRRIEAAQVRRIKRLCKVNGPDNGPVRRALIILLRAAMGVHSPSLGRRVRISDIWRSPGYEA